MRLIFDEAKAAQAAAYLLKKRGAPINLMALVKLLYLADRAALVETGYTITGDRMVSMPHGPVLSQILDLINLEPRPSQEQSPWFKAIGPRDGYDLTLIQDPGVDALSEYETEILDRICDLYGQLNQWQLRDLTHELPEWQDPHGSSMPIDPLDILRDAGLGDPEIRQIVEEAEQRYVGS